MLVVEEAFLKGLVRAPTDTKTLSAKTGLSERTAGKQLEELEAEGVVGGLNYGNGRDYPYRVDYYYGR